MKSRYGRFSGQTALPLGLLPLVRNTLKSQIHEPLLSYQLRLVRHVSAGVAIGVHEQLGVGMDGDEGLEVAVVLDQAHDVLHFDL